MKPTLRDRQALKRLRKMEKSASLRLGEHLTTSVVKPWRFPFLPISFPLLVGKILLEKVGIIQEPETRVEWQRSEPGHGLLVFVDGYTKGHALNILQDLQDLKTLQPEFPVLVVCTSKFQTVFSNTDFPVFVLPNKDALLNEQKSDWGSLLEEQLGGIAGFFLPSMVIIVGPYPHRGIKNLLRSNPEIAIYLDQRPSKTIKKMKSSFYTHLTGVLRDSGDQNPAPKSTSLHKVRADALTSWIVSMNEGLSFNIDDSKLFLIEQSKDLVKITEEANRDTNVISKELERIAKEFGLEKLSSLVLHSLLVMEQKDQSYGQKYTRDLFVAAIRSYGKMNIDYMLELAHSKMPKYEDERAAKSIIQFIKNSENPEESTVFMKYVKDKQWIQREVKTVTTKLLKMYGVSQEVSRKADDLSQMNTEEVENFLRSELETGSLEVFDKYLVDNKSNLKEKVRFLLVFLAATIDVHDKKIHSILLNHGLFENKSRGFSKNISNAFMMYGDSNSALQALQNGPVEDMQDLIHKANTINKKLNGDWINSILENVNQKPTVKEGDKILYLTHMSLPFESAGYCTRTHGLMTNLLSYNSKVKVQSRFAYPLDKGKLKHLKLDEVIEEQTIDGLRYGFDRIKDVGIADPDELGYIERAAKKLIEHAQNEKSNLIQAASNHVNGAIGLVAARSLGLPFVYEVRGLWHMSRVARQPHFYHHSEYDAMDAAEVSICKQADIVFAITHAVRHYLISKGVDSDKILVLPNGVDTKRFQPIPEDEMLKSDLGLGNGPIVGYVGSFVKYEGLDILIDAFHKLSLKYDDARLLMVGDGVIRTSLENQVQSLGLQEKVVFTGRVPHDDVNKYHSLIDIAPFPRTPDIVCEFISPLKPFESMAMGQVVVASDVAALSEIIEDGVNGRLFRKGDSVSLAEVIDSIIQEEGEISRLSEAGLNWVKQNRDWNNLADYLNKTHSHILNGSEIPELLGSSKPLTIINGKVSTVIERTPKLMVIMDEFSTTALEPDAELFKPTPENWERMLADNEVDSLIVESAWVGNSGSWHKKVGWYSDEEISDLRNLVSECRRRNIPTIFYNKEDPVHFSRFSKTSAMFDQVFTTDENCIPKYKALKDSNIRDVDYIRFAAQPEFHHQNNTDFSNRKGIAFAGTYYAGKYPDRCQKMDLLFDACPKDELVLYDRQSDGGNPQYVFPERFADNLLPKLEYGEMLQKHRDHKIFLNVNSVEDSRTMVARRVFEIPASGAALVSGPGLGIETVFGNIIPVIDNSESAEMTIKRLSDDDFASRSLVKSSRRVVLRNHTNIDRLQKMMLSVGLDYSKSKSTQPQINILESEMTMAEILNYLCLQSKVSFKLNFSSPPNCTTSKLLWSRLESKGVELSDSHSGKNYIEVSNLSLTDEYFLEDIELELKHCKSNFKLQTNDNRVVAKTELADFDEEVNIEYFSEKPVNTDGITSISLPEGEWDYPNKILLAGHDLKFAEPIAEALESMGIEVLRDKWSNHSRHDMEQSLELYDQADAVWCEWALGNVEWFSNLEGTKPIFVRFHAQERKLTDYLSNSNWDKIANIGFVSPEYLQLMSEFFSESKDKLHFIPNARYLDGTYVPSGKPRNKKIGMVGMVPKSKRLDRAIELLELLLEKDESYELHIAGKGPDDYPWLMKRQKEIEFYSSLEEKIDQYLKEGKIVFHGFVDDMKSFYSGVDSVISVSDDESFHLTLIDGPQFGCAAFTLNWDGAEKIYPQNMIFSSVEQMAESIYEHQSESKLFEYSREQNATFSQMYGKEKVALSILHSILNR